MGKKTTEQKIEELGIVALVAYCYHYNKRSNEQVDQGIEDDKVTFNAGMVAKNAFGAIAMDTIRGIIMGKLTTLDEVVKTIEVMEKDFFGAIDKAIGGDDDET